MTSIPQNEDNIFKNSNCDITAVPVVDFDFIPSDIVCAPSPTPAAIFSCTAPIILPEPPTDVGVTCPVFSAVSTIAVGYSSAADGATDCDIVANPDATLRIRRTSVDPCDYEIDLDIRVPIPRPPCETTLKAGAFNTNIGFAECVAPQSTVQITKNTIPGTCDTPDQCEFTIDLDIGIPIPRTPCPVINVNEFLTEVGYGDCVTGENRFTVVTRHRPPEDCNDPGQCEFDIDLQISVPIPELDCPTINIDNFSTSAGFTGGPADAACPQSKFEIVATKTPGTCNTPPQCDFDLNLEVFVPVPRIPCPELTVASVDIQSGYERCLENPENRFTITSRHVPPTSCQDAGQCAFDVELAIAVPIPEIPCPTISIDDFQVVAAFADSAALAAGSRFEIVTRHQPPSGCNDPGVCDFGVQLVINVPIPRPICPTIFVKEFDVKTSIACPTEPSIFKIESKIANEDEPDQPPICEFETTLKLNIPIPEIPCPRINITKFIVGTAFDELDCLTNSNRFELIRREIPGTCNTPKTCEFDLELEIAVPIPPIKCPDINVGTFNVTSGFVGADCLGENKLEVEKIIIAAEDCNTAESCEFQINLDIAVPIPVPRCPIITSINQFTLRESDTETKARVNRARLEVLTAQTPAGNCNEVPTCNYNIAFDFDLLVPNVCSHKVIIDPIIFSVGYDLPTYFYATYENLPRPDCLTTLGLDLSIGIPRPPCTIGSGQVNLFNLPATASPFANMTVINTGEPGETCSFNILLNLGLPAVCPVTFLDPLIDALVGEENDIARIVDFRIVPILVTICPTFLPILKISSPKPCKPVFYKGNVQGYWIENWHENEIKVDFNIEPQEERCQYKYNLLVGIPKKATRLVKGEVRAQYTVCEAGEPDLFIEITPPDANGIQQLNVTLILPKPPSYVKKDWTVEGSDGSILGSVELDIDNIGCERGIGGRIILNAVACPTSGGGTSAFTQKPVFELQDGPSDNEQFLPYSPAEDGSFSEAENYARNQENIAAADAKILDAVVRNLQLDRETNAPINPAFYTKMKQFFTQIQNSADNE